MLVRLSSIAMKSVSSTATCLSRDAIREIAYFLRKVRLCRHEPAILTLGTINLCLFLFYRTTTDSQAHYGVTTVGTNTKPMIKITKLIIQIHKREKKKPSATEMDNTIVKQVKLENDYQDININNVIENKSNLSFPHLSLTATTATETRIFVVQNTLHGGMIAFQMMQRGFPFKYDNPLTVDTSDGINWLIVLQYVIIRA